MGAALRVVLDLQVQDGRGDEFCALWRSHAERVGSLPDNHGQSLGRRAEDPDSFLVVTDWTDEKAFRDFERSPMQQEYLQALWPMRQRGSMTLLTIVAR